jgi:type II secretory pathway pseudopilin PulG
LTRRGNSGFTLIEMVFLTAIFFVAVVSLTAVLGEAAERITDNDSSAKAAQLAQEKAEAILTDRRNPGRDYAYVTSAAYPTENPVSGYTGFTRTVSITDFSSNALCPNATMGCKLVVVTVAKNSITLATVTFLLARSA